MAILQMTTDILGLCWTLLPNEQCCLPTSEIKGTARQTTTTGHGSAACCVEAEARLHPVLRAEAHEMISNPGCPLGMLTSARINTDWPLRRAVEAAVTAPAPGGPARVQMF